MIAWTRHTITGASIAALIVALATFGGYRLAASPSSAPGHVRLAVTSSVTWVSPSGSDANATNGNLCGRLTPCASFYGANAATSPGGQINAIDSGTYGGLNITQPMTIDGGPGRALILGPGGITVNAGPNDVVILRHLQLHFFPSVLVSGTYGVQFHSGKALILDDVSIEGYPQHGILVDAAGPVSVTITNSHIQNNGQAGIALTPSGGTVQATISHSQIARNYFGLVAQDGSDVSLTDSVVTGSTNIGVGCVTYGGGPCTIQTARDRLDHNYQAIFMAHGAGNGQITESISDDDIFSNTYGIYGDFGGTLNAVSAGNNRFVNNPVNGTVTGSVTQM